MAYDSANVPALFKEIKWRSYTVNLDVGGGKDEDATLYLAEKGVTNLVYDPDSRDADHNQSVITAVMRIGGSDSVTLANVLNVIPTWKDRDAILYYSRLLVKTLAPVYIGVYEGDRSGSPSVGSKGWQANLELKDYHDAVANKFRVISVTKTMITAVKDD
jgi:hypothetical protein